MDVFTVESILQKLDDIVPNGVLGCESLCPGQQFSGVNSSLLDWETIPVSLYSSAKPFEDIPECETQVDWLIGSGDIGSNFSQESVHRIGNVV